MTQETKLGLYHFKMLFDIMHSIHTINNTEELISYSLSKIANAMSSGGGTIFLRQPDETLYPVASFGINVEELRKQVFKVGEGFVGWAVEHIEPVKAEKTVADNRFNKSVDKSTGFETRNLIAAPITSKGRAIGAIELLNRLGGPFVEVDLEFITVIGRELGIAIDHMDLIEKLEDKRILLNALLGSLATGLIMLDIEGKLLEMSPYAAEVLGLDYDKIIRGTIFSQVFKGCPEEFVKAVDKITKLTEPVKRQEARVVINGKEKIIGYSGAPLFNDDIHMGYTMLFQDITRHYMA
ncbi:MAG: GAF domain-containing protein [Elusimicrobiota bacterium]